jgi:hypothetical protein
MILAMRCPVSIAIGGALPVRKRARNSLGSSRVAHQLIERLLTPLVLDFGEAAGDFGQYALTGPGGPKDGIPVGAAVLLALAGR